MVNRYLWVESLNEFIDKDFGIAKDDCLEAEAEIKNQYKINNRIFGTSINNIVKER